MPPHSSHREISACVGHSGLVNAAKRPGRHTKSSCGRPESKFWLAVRAEAGVVIPTGVANDRSQPLRRLPSDLCACLPPELLGSIKNAVLDSVAIAEQALMTVDVEGRDFWVPQGGHCSKPAIT